MKGSKVQAEVIGECWPSLEKLSPCEHACPLKIDVPRYVRAIALGSFRDALAIVREKTPLPLVCGRICHHPCEEACLRAKIDEPIAIEALKRFAGDYGLTAESEKPTPIDKTRKEKVAVIGSGPAGLTAAHDLVRRGYGVTIYEALPVAGGMLAVGIPEFVLPRKILKADIDYIQALGVEIKTNTAIGQDVTLDDLLGKYKAIFLAVGASESGRLNIPGIGSDSVLYALPFLQDVNLGKKVKVKGKVAVIGGGNVAIDCARVAVRLGASEVNLACLESREEMPAFKWEIEKAEEEGIKIHCSWAPQKIRAEGKKIVGIDFAHVKSIGFDAEGRIKPTLIKEKEHRLDADSVIIAIGQSPNLASLDGANRLEVSKRGTLVVDPDTLATNLPGVFAGGDAVTSRGTATEAIAAGQKAALSIHAYLRGLDLQEMMPKTVEKLEVAEEKMPRFVERRERQRMPAIPIAERVRSFKEVDSGFTQATAIAEARRCLNCPMCGNCIFDRLQMCCETASRLL